MQFSATRPPPTTFEENKNIVHSQTMIFCYVAISGICIQRQNSRDVTVQQPYWSKLQLFNTPIPAGNIFRPSVHNKSHVS